MYLAYKIHAALNFVIYLLYTGFLVAIAMEVFTEYYPKLCNTMTDIENLLKYFVQRNIIKSEDQDVICSSNIKSCDKVTAFLKYISGPLQDGNEEGFHTMLNIMEKHGVEATKKLSKELKTTLEQQVSGKVLSLMSIKSMH